ncbi:MAG: hypothetical protein J4400_01990 [Candidatus Aenigmarchaeota archaeon]|nr:hypothetical protein [Candidatus Aenigmarchaeota archaeon]
MKFSREKLEDARRAGRLMGQSNERVVRIYLIDYTPPGPENLERTDVGVVIEKGLDGVRNYDFLRLGFIGEVSGSAYYKIHHFFPEEYAASSCLEHGRTDMLRKMMQNGELVYRRNELRRKVRAMLGLD